MVDSNTKYHLVTRADFDGIAAGALLIELGLVDDVEFAEPNAVQNGQVHIDEHYITTNLPYVEGVHMCFDHHISETERVGERDNHFIEADAPSAARVVYNHFGGKKTFTLISDEMMTAVDVADSAQYSEQDILAPDPWALLNFIMDPRTGLARFEHFDISHEQFMKDMMVYVRHHPVDEILAIPDVADRVRLYNEHEEKFELQLRAHTKTDGGVIVSDMRGIDSIFAGNRFTVYALYPECNVSISMTHSEDGKQTIFAVGKSILNRSNTANIGGLMLQYSGGGHNNAGSCRVDNDQADSVLYAIISHLNAAG